MSLHWWIRKIYITDWSKDDWRKLSVDEHGSFGLELALKFYMFVRLPKISSNLVGANITQDHLKSSYIVA